MIFTSLTYSFIKINIFSNIIYLPVSYLKTTLQRIDSVSDFRKKPTPLCLIDRISPWSLDPRSRHREQLYPLGQAEQAFTSERRKSQVFEKLFLNKKNGDIYCLEANNCINIPSPQTQILFTVLFSYHRVRTGELNSHDQEKEGTAVFKALTHVLV